MFRKEDLPVELMDLMLSPSYVYEIAQSLSVVGYFTLFGASVKGGFLWFIWIVEAIGILGAGALGGLAVMHEEVFCEDCNRWAEDINFDLRLGIDDKDAAKVLIDTDIEKILNFRKLESPNSEHIRVNLHQCSKCRNMNTIDIDLMTYEKGEVKEKNADFSSVYVLSTSQFNLFFTKKNEPSN